MTTLPQQGWGAWDASWAWSIVLVAVTLAFHSAGTVCIAWPLIRLENNATRKRDAFLRTLPGAILVIVTVGVALVLLHAFECLIWGIAYLRLGALPSPADALLYSVDSMTTRGESGLTLTHQWLMMGAVEAMNGMLLFGISTALLIAVMQRIYALAFKRHAS
jgi:hypothetical protein